MPITQNHIHKTMLQEMIDWNNKFIISNILKKHGFHSSSVNPPHFKVLYSGEYRDFDYWHPDRNLVVYVNHTVDEQNKKMESYLVLDSNGNAIRELFDASSCDSYFNENNIESINKPQQSVNVAQAPQYPQIQNPPQQPYPIQPQPSQQIVYQNKPSSLYPPQYPQPLLDINIFLNPPQLTNYLNLQTIIPSNHVIHKMACYLHNEHPLPISTLILVGLGVASGMTARKWNCAYQKRGTKPICLYVVAEQKKGKGKSAALNIFQEPLKNCLKNRIKKIKNIIQTQNENLQEHLSKKFDDTSKEYKEIFKFKTDQLKEQIELNENKLKKTYALLPKTQITPGALEESLNNTNGFFLVASDEQSLIDTLITGNGNKSNAVLLNGRNAEDFCSEYTSRKGYNGTVIGSFICFAQEGSIGKIMRASGATGLCERFLMVSEPQLPDRFYQGELLKNNNPPQVNNDQELFDEYASKFNFLKDIFEKALGYDELITLKISNNGWHDIKMFQNNLTINKQNGYLSHEMLSTMADKADMQIMSIASNLYLLDLDDKTQPSIHGEHYIPDNYIKMAIDVTRELIMGVRQYCDANGITGDKEQIEVIMNCFFDKKKSKYVSLSLEKIKHKCEQVNPFTNLPKNKRRPLIVDLINYLTMNNIVLFQDGVYLINPLTQQPQVMPNNVFL